MRPTAIAVLLLAAACGDQDLDPPASSPDATVAPDAAACAEGQEPCGETCASLDRDPQNCGACGETCAAVDVCTDRECVDTGCWAPGPIFEYDLSISNGDFALGPEGNLVVALDEILEVDRVTGEVRVLVDSAGGFQRGVIYDETSDTYYFVELKQGIFSLHDGVVSLVVDQTPSWGVGHFNTLAIAPSSFGDHAGKLLLATRGSSTCVDCGVWVVDPADDSRAQLGSIPMASDLAIGPDGTVYVSDYDRGVAVVAATGGLDYVVELTGINGLAVSPSGDEIYVIRSEPMELLAVSLSDGSMTTLLNSPTGTDSVGQVQGIVLDSCGTVLAHVPSNFTHRATAVVP